MAAKTIFSLFLGLISITGVAQNISGVVYSKETQKALQDVSIYLENTTIGTTTNSEGKFELNIPEKTKRKQKITFSCIGYSTVQIPIKELKDSILLQKEVQRIEEVMVANKRMLKTSLPYQKVSKLNCGLYAFGAFLKDDRIYIVGGDESLRTDEAKAFRTAVDKSGLDLDMSDITKEMGEDVYWENYSNLLQIYDLKTNTWTVKKDLFDKRAYHNVELYKNKAYVIGGTQIKGKHELLQDKIEIYYADSDSIVVDDVNPHQAINFASGIAGDYLFMAGGSVKKNKIGTITYTNKAHLLAIKTGQWFEMTPMPKAKECKGLFAGKNFYIIGGNNGNDLKQIEFYDFKRDSWETVLELPIGISSPALCYADETIFIFENKHFWTYNIHSKTVRRYDIKLNLTHVEMFYTNNRIYIVGGDEVEEYSNEPSRFIYSIDLKDFSKTEHLTIRKS